MEAVRAALGGDVHDATGSASVLSRKVVGYHAELTDGIERSVLARPGDEEVNVLRAVEQDVRRSSARAVDGYADAADGRTLSIARDVAGRVHQRECIAR